MTRMAREHMPIQIGLPPEAAWEVAEPAPISYIAFVGGEELPDPGDAFTAAGESFGVAPQDVEPVPLPEDSVAWAFAFSIPSRPARIMCWCERAVDGASPDGRASDARWVIFVETLLDAARPVDDAVALVATVARAGGARTRLAYDPGLGVAWSAAELAQLFLGSAAGELVDERHLYRIELAAQDREQGPFWITTVGLARVARPELEMLEVPAPLLRPALELVDALAAHFVQEPLPHAGVPFEAGSGISLALVPAAEAAETLPPGVPGGPSDRRGIPPGPRAAICAAGKRGAFRQVWVTPTDELTRLAQGDAALLLSPRVSAVRTRLAQRTWAEFAQARARHAARADVAFLARIAASPAVAAPDAVSDHASAIGQPSREWLAVDQATVDGGLGRIERHGGKVEHRAFAISDLRDWRIVGLRADAPEIGPESTRLLG
jgi:hypothetical protein